MDSGEHVTDVLCQHVDGSLQMSDQETVTAHLAACPACARDAALQMVVRRALRTHASSLTETAPDSLRARVAGLASPVVTQAAGVVVPFPANVVRRATRRWTRVLPMTAAATLLLAVGAGLLSPTGTVLAAQLTLDHLKCRAIASVSPGADPTHLGREWEQSWGWPVTVPGSRSDLDLSFVGLRHCLYHDGTMAHLMYDYRGHRVSLFVMPQRDAVANRFALLGQRTETWSAGGRAYAVVADEGAGELGSIAAYFRQVVR
jgi:anti-sigma factor (TIGR02949 family)